VNAELDPFPVPVEAEYQRLFATMLNGIAHCRILWDGDRPVDWIYLRVNRAFEQQTGFRGLIGRRVSEAVPGLLEQDPEWLQIYGRVARTGVPERFEREVAALGIWFDIAVYSPGPDEFVAICELVTERKRGEAALLESERKYRTLFETAPRGIVYHDADGRILSANPAAERILGLSIDQMQGRSPVDPRWRAVHEDGSPFPGAGHPASTALASGQPSGEVVMGVFHPGEDATHWIRVSAVPLFRAGEARPFQVYATFDDITESRRAQAELVAGQERLRLALELSHTGGWEQDLVDGKGFHTAEHDRIFGYPAPHPDWSYERFLGHVHPEDRERVFSALEQIHRAIALVEAGFEAGQVALRVAAPVDCRLHGFPNEFSQVLLNLLANARQAIQEAGRETGTVTLELGSAGGFGRILVRDDGTGIPEDLLERIFEPYFSTREAGTGIGLYLSRQIIQTSMGGRILARNLARGAEFELLVPLSAEG